MRNLLTILIVLFSFVTVGQAMENGPKNIPTECKGKEIHCYGGGIMFCTAQINKSDRR